MLDFSTNMSSKGPNCSLYAAENLQSSSMAAAAVPPTDGKWSTHRYEAHPGLSGYSAVQAGSYEHHSQVTQEVRKTCREHPM